MWGDFVRLDDSSKIEPMLALLERQAAESIPHLENFDPSRPFRVGWFVEQGSIDIETVTMSAAIICLLLITAVATLGIYRLLF